jgi:ATP-binding cassette, subfamily B, bacterial MsbA
MGLEYFEGLGPALRALRFGRPYARQLVLAVVCGIAGSAANIVIPLETRTLLDGVISHHSIANLNRAAALLVAVVLVSALFMSVRTFLVNAVGEGISRDLRIQLFDHLLHLSPDFYDNRRTGDLLSQASNDTELVETLVGPVVMSSITSGITFVGACVLLFVIDWRLALVTYLLVPTMVAAVMFVGRRSRRLSRKAQQSLGEANAVLEESLSTVPTVLSFGRERYELGRYASAIQRTYDAGIASAKLNSAFSGLSTLGGLGVFALLLWLGTRDVVAHELTVGGLIAFLYFVMMLSSSLQSIGFLISSLARVSGGIERVMETLGTAPTIVSPTPAVVLRNVTGEIAFNDVFFAYRPELAPVLKGMSFRCMPGERIALVGVSGAGKSTTVKLLQRFYDVSAGSVTIDGTDIRAAELSSVRDTMAAVMQEAPLFGGTIRENIAYGRLDASDAEIEQVARMANAHEFITALPFGYETPVGDRGVKLSGGQRQRIAIARAMLKDAPILILDEATNSLDGETESLVHDALERLMEGRTTLMITHRLSTARGADRIVVLEGGRVVEDGPHAALVRQGGVYARMHASLLRTDSLAVS